MAKPLLGSASSLDRTLACPASNQLPHEYSPAGEQAEFGTAAHKILELAPAKGIDYALRQVSEKWVSKLRHLPWKKTVAPYAKPRGRELSMVYRGKTRKVDILGNGLDRAYGELDEWDISGTADVVLLGYLSIEVHDYKTGKRIPDPKDSAQLKHLAMMAAKTAPEVQYVIGNFQRIRENKRLKKRVEFSVKDEHALFTRMDLDVHEARVQDALVRAEAVKQDIAQGKTPEVVPGEHCRFCPAKNSCPDERGRLWGIRKREYA